MRRGAVGAAAGLGAMVLFLASLPAAAIPALAGSACTSVAASASPSTDPGPGTTIAITGTASGCSNPLYKFWIQYPNSTTWQLVQGYAANSATYNFDTSSKPPGVYHFQVWTRDTSSPGTHVISSGTFDAYTVIPYTVPAWPYRPCSTFNASYSPPSPQQVGTVVTVSASPTTFTNCPNPRYQFWMKEADPNYNTVQPYHIVQGYSALSTYTWNTNGLRADVYGFQIWIRDASSPGAYSAPYGSWDAYETLAWYQLTSSPCQRVGASASSSSPQPRGNPVTITAFPFGCPNPRLQFEMLAPGSQTWQVLQPYAASTTFSWTTNGPAGTYKFIVKARDTSSAGTTGTGNPNGSWDAYVVLTYTLT
jgi:hypothetical protein